MIPVKGGMLYATHGHVFNESNPPLLQKEDILLGGHTHIPCCNKIGDIVYMNPGSVSIPKEGSWHGYMTMEEGSFEWKDMNGTIHKKYLK